MSHEQSETIQLPNGTWINVYGGDTPQRGRPLPGERPYGTVGEAVEAAKLRSSFGKQVPLPPKAPVLPAITPQIAPGQPMFGKPIPRANPVSANHPDPFAMMSFDELRMLRERMPNAQQFLAPYEHRAFAREYVMQNPALGLGLMGAIPGYQVAKGLGLMGSRTGLGNPLGQMGQGYMGMGEGLLGYLRRVPTGT
jgi:hypothetical protein